MEWIIPSPLYDDGGAATENPLGIRRSLIIHAFDTSCTSRVDHADGQQYGIARNRSSANVRNQLALPALMLATNVTTYIEFDFATKRN